FRGYPGTTVTRTDRRWFEYTFSPRSASGVLAEPLFKRAHVFADSWRGEWNPVSPIWRWNADVWYVDVEGKGLKVFPNARESAPPQEVIAIFQEAEQVSNTPTQRSASVSDVCLGFCYDGLSAMGYTFVNERCGNDGSGYVCR
ncbi:MAG TPA: hypothetical protein VMT82_08955, partial [candidate division Zixibacteria bacterium]|nr:hypothetical protein [candidate division Zixibacteria bacterium]